VFRDLEPAVSSDRGLLQAGRRATASGQGTVRTQVASARIAGDFRPTLLHPNGNLLGQAVFTLERLQRRSTLRPQPCAVTAKIPFGSRMHEASLQDLEATTKTTLRKGDGLLIGGFR